MAVRKRKKRNKMDQRTKIIWSHFSIFLCQSTTEIKKDRQRTTTSGSSDQETKREEKRIEEEKRIY